MHAVGTAVIYFLKEKCVQLHRICTVQLRMCRHVLVETCQAHTRIMDQEKHCYAQLTTMIINICILTLSVSGSCSGMSHLDEHFPWLLNNY
jgi:hypothetical protein